MPETVYVRKGYSEKNVEVPAMGLGKSGNFGYHQPYPGLTAKYYGGGQKTLMKTIAGEGGVDPSRPPGMMTPNQQTPWAGYQKNNGFFL
jgi:hypothetical protein